MTLKIQFECDAAGCHIEHEISKFDSPCNKSLPGSWLLDGETGYHYYPKYRVAVEAEIKARS